ncbi:MAG: CRISPR-associated helicase Cas3' [Chloroflexi bacterium]|nr:MAG: CRISPR-associated helicase Cas3' [Chloroflexota bacterium]
MFMDVNSAYKNIAGFDTPNPMQTAVWQAITEDNDMGIGLLLKGLTGSGKTEAVAIPAINENRRLIMVYPTRSLVDDQIMRFEKLLTNYSCHNKGQLVTLTVDTGAQSMRYCYRNGKTEPTPGGERSTRHLYTGNVIITTLDKFIYRFFGFGEPLKSYIFPLRIRYMNPIICFDEAHSYDEIAFINFERLVKTLYQNGKDIVLMTATMPMQYLKRFHDLDVFDFASGQGARAMADWKTYPHPGKHLYHIPASIERLEDAPSEAIERIIAETRQRYQFDKRMIVTIESVKDAAYVYTQLRDEFRDNIWLYHGRLTQARRKEVYAKLKEQEGKENGRYLLISTSAIEVGCDLDAHILISQLCDPDRLIQRAGRCNRKQAIPDASIVVVGDNIPEWATALTEQQPKYLQELQAQNGKLFNPEPLVPLMEKELVSDPRVEIMFDMLHEYVYDARLENKNLHENGLVITRSWEPSIILCQGEDENGLLCEAITVPISYCRTPKDEQPITLLLGTDGGGLQKRVFNKDERRFENKTVGKWENGYKADLLFDFGTQGYEDYDPKLGYVNLPFLFEGPIPAGAKKFMRRQEEAHEAKIWYIDPENVTIKANEIVGETAVTANKKDVA